MSLAYPEQLYGRRKGKPLKANQLLLMDRFLKGTSFLMTHDLKKTFGDKVYDEYWLEIGFGGGEHIAAQAEKHPHVGFIGAEAFLNGVASLVQLINKNQLANVRILSGDGRQLLKTLPSKSVSKVIILFPDPWPKRRHHKRRLVNEHNLQEISRILASSGELRVASDHKEYIQWVLYMIKTMPQFVPQFDPSRLPTVKPNDWESTRYEQKALSAGKPCYYLSFRMR
jgi:tRNA (guanine-N7-)-methyltransferase